MKKIQFFNMIEVTLALAVVGIGISGIMGLFPVAVQASRDAVGDNYSPDVANMFMTYIAQDGRRNTKWSNTVDPDLGSLENGDESIIATLPTTKPSSGASSGSDIPGTKIQSTGTTGVYLVCIGPGTSDYSTTTLKDFNAEVRIWKKNLRGLYIPGLSGTENAELHFRYGATILIEVSWPVEKPYDNRSKRIFVCDMYNTDPL